MQQYSSQTLRSRIIWNLPLGLQIIERLLALYAMVLAWLCIVALYLTPYYCFSWPRIIAFFDPVLSLFLSTYCRFFWLRIVAFKLSIVIFPGLVLLLFIWLRIVAFSNPILLLFLALYCRFQAQKLLSLFLASYCRFFPWSCTIAFSGPVLSLFLAPYCCVQVQSVFQLAQPSRAWCLKLGLAGIFQFIAQAN